jgi:hypothetical protein
MYERGAACHDDAARLCREQRRGGVFVMPYFVTHFTVVDRVSGNRVSRTRKRYSLGSVPVQKRKGETGYASELRL